MKTLMRSNQRLKITSFLKLISVYLNSQKARKKKNADLKHVCIVRSLAKVIWIHSITATFCFYSRCHKTEFCSWRYVFTTTKSITFCFEVAPRGFVATPLLWPWCLKPCSNCQLLPFHLCFSSSWSLYATRLSAPPWVALTLTPEAALMRANVFGSVPDGMVSGPVLLREPLPLQHPYLRLDLESCQEPCPPSFSRTFSRGFWSLIPT